MDYNSPFLSSTSVWSEKEINDFNLTFIKAKEMHHKINTEITSIIHSSSYKKQFPVLSEKFKSITNLSNLDSQSTSKLDWIKVEVLKHLRKEGDLEITLEFSKKVLKAAGEIGKVIKESENGSIAYSDYVFMNEYLSLYKNFLIKNNSKEWSSEIWGNLLGYPIDTIDKKQAYPKAIEDLTQILDTLDELYLEKHQLELVSYAPFLSAAERIVFVSVESLLKPHLSSLGDNPGTAGIAFLHNSAEKQKLETLKQFTTSEEFTQESIETIERENNFKNKFAEADTEKKKFAVALEVLDNINSQALPIPLQLNAYCIVSKNSTECPKYFKNVTQTLCQQIEKHNSKKTEPQQNDSPECNVM